MRPALTLLAVGLGPGLVAQKAWPLRPLEDVPVPQGSAAAPIDRFLRARQRAAGVAPVSRADRRTLLRRTTYDLTGLPPSPDETAAFLADESRDAFALVVDRLLASTHYAEKQARLWLDLVRYADTAGDSSDYPIADAWRYRNWVIRAFGEDKPFDEFLRQQIAGDLLADDAPRERFADLQVATGFLALSRRFGVGVRQSMHLVIEDTIDVLGRSVLGLTLRCARCHDHKYDPITMRDYYALYGIFQSMRYPFPGSENQRRPSDLVPLVPRKEYDAAMGPWRSRYAPAKKRSDRLQQELRSLERRIRGLRRKKAAAALREATTARQELRSRWEEAERKRRRLAAERPPIGTAYAVAAAQPRDAHVHLEGNPHKQGDRIPRGFPAAVVCPETPRIAQGSGRLELARWLTQPRHPLTARVFVNRLWQQHFGRGLVPTPSNFGALGQRTSHPQLLDWLACRFVADGWSVKAMHRRMLLSEAYQRASRADAAAQEADPSNRWLWRQRRRRLQAEEIRDALLAVSGNLDRTEGREHPFPPTDVWDWTQHRPFTAVYPSNKRSIYVMRQRIRKHPFFELFDGADGNVPTCRRRETTVPAQALFLINSEFVQEQARSFARRLLGVEDPAARVRWAHALAFGRPARPHEVDRALDYLHRYRETAGEPEGELLAWTSWCRTLLASNEFCYVD